MKAVIVDVRGKYAAAMREDGAVVRIRNERYGIGQEIVLRERKTHAVSVTWRRILSGAAAAVFAVMAGAGTAYALPYGSVTVDADTDTASSLVYTINCFDYVLDVQGGDESGEELLSHLERRGLRHMHVDRAIRTAVGEITSKEGHEKDFDGMRIRTDTRSRRHTEKLEKELGSFSRREDRSRKGREHEGGRRSRDGRSARVTPAP